MKGASSYLASPAGYAEFLAELKERVRSSQLTAMLSVNRELIVLYWETGRSIVERQRQYQWGDQVMDRLSRDLQTEFPGIAGLSRRNLYRMRAFYLGYTEERPIVPQAVARLPASAKRAPSKGDSEILPQHVAQLSAAVRDQLGGELDGRSLPGSVAAIPWGHNAILIEKIKDPILRLWYARKTLQHGWSRAILTYHLERNLHEHEGRALTNFQQTLPPPQSDLAQQVLKDPYNFDFLTLRVDALERELEKGLLDHIQKFLLELGVGFAFVGRQVHLEVDGEDYYLDLLLYHLRLRCYVVVDLKRETFKPEFAGKMNFYLSAVDDRMRHPDDQPSIGLLLCKVQNRLTVEYALRDVRKPIGVAEWKTKLVESLPKNLQGKLPTIEEIEAELEKSAEAKPTEVAEVQSRAKRKKK
jgi:predicted nuclease of restriction endonuclease-like (RecB) superfamily